ncbi:MAG: hypothetical protein HY273_06400 [Gammaproteobacteria bacterium]|nr:hypothetical protein [Gammaproteobacteria bacterium]
MIGIVYCDINMFQPDIEAEIFFLSTEEGGRHVPVKSGYRPDHNFGAGMLNAAVHEYISCEFVAPGQTARANIGFANPGFKNGRFYPGFEFKIQEGGRLVGRGVITKIFNAALRAP